MRIVLITFIYFLFFYHLNSFAIESRIKIESNQSQLFNINERLFLENDQRIGYYRSIFLHSNYGDLQVLNNEWGDTPPHERLETLDHFVMELSQKQKEEGSRGLKSLEKVSITPLSLTHSEKISLGALDLGPENPSDEDFLPLANYEKEAEVLEKQFQKKENLLVVYHKIDILLEALSFCPSSAPAKGKILDRVNQLKNQLEKEYYYNNLKLEIIENPHFKNFILTLYLQLETHAIHYFDRVIFYAFVIHHLAPTKSDLWIHVSRIAEESKFEDCLNLLEKTVLNSKIYLGIIKTNNSDLRKKLADSIMESFPFRGVPLPSLLGELDLIP